MEAPLPSHEEAPEYRAAGVLPISLVGETIVALIGAEIVYKTSGSKGRVLWRDFGGQREAWDEDSAATAARECAEETLGLFHSCAVTGQAVKNAAQAMASVLRTTAHTVHQLRQGSYHLYLVHAPYVTALMFALASAQNKTTHAIAGAEKMAFEWVPLQDLVRAVLKPAPHYRLECLSSRCDGAAIGIETSLRQFRRFPLHPRFVHGLRQAWEEGAVARVQLIKTIAPSSCSSWLIRSSKQRDVVVDCTVLKQGGAAHSYHNISPILEKTGGSFASTGPIDSDSPHCSVARGLGWYVTRPDILDALAVPPDETVQSEGVAWVMREGLSRTEDREEGHSRIFLGHLSVDHHPLRPRVKKKRKKTRNQRLQLRRKRSLIGVRNQL